MLELNNQLMTLSEELTSLEEDIFEKKEELRTTGKELEEAKTVEDKQYKSMKKRIQFLYENGRMDYLTMLIKADSFGDFLNQAEYASELASYDRRMLHIFRDTKKEIEEKEALVKAEKQELEELQVEVERKQEDVTELVQSTGGKIAQYNSEIEEAQKKVAEIEGRLEQQKSVLDEWMEKARREEEEAAKNQNNGGGGTDFAGGTSNNGAVNAQGGEMDILAAIIHCEASGEGYEGQLAVGAVIMNRVRSSRFPNTITGVVYQAGQFSPVASGRFILALSQGLASASCRQAAQDAIKGKSNIGNCLSFRRNDGSVNGYVLGDHVFY